MLRFRFFKMLGISILLLVALAIIGVRTGKIHIPNDYNPWATLDLDATPNWLTRHKLAALSQDPDLCVAVLHTSDFQFEPLPDRVTGVACGFHNAVRIDALRTIRHEPFSLTCRAAVSLALWERHVLQPKAREYFGEAVTRIDHFGSYSCRNVYGRPQATRSRHATAEAFDVAGFRLRTGERISIVKDWNGEDRESAFLRDIRDGACSFFDAVLSPAYNHAHHDHFHLDRGPYRSCR